MQLTSAPVRKNILYNVQGIRSKDVKRVHANLHEQKTLCNGDIPAQVLQ